MSNTPQTITTSKLFNVNWNDFLKGLVVSVGGAVITVVENTIEAGNFTFNWTNIWHTMLAAFVAYIGKNFFTNSQTVIKGLPQGVSTTVTIPPQGTSQPLSEAISSNQKEEGSGTKSSL